MHGYWLKNFSSLHERIAHQQLQECLVHGNVPTWMTEARTVLIMKDIKKGNVASNYRPITCLPMMYKLLTGIIAEDLYSHIEDQQCTCSLLEVFVSLEAAPVYSIHE